MITTAKAREARPSLREMVDACKAVRRLRWPSQWAKGRSFIVGADCHHRLTGPYLFMCANCNHPMADHRLVLGDGAAARARRRGGVRRGFCHGYTRAPRRPSEPCPCPGYVSIPQVVVPWHLARGRRVVGTR